MINKEKQIVFYSMLNGVGNTVLSYNIARLLRLPFYQEEDNDLAFYLNSIEQHNKYTKKQIEQLDDEDYEYGAVYDLKSENKKILNIATDIIVLTNNAYLDILKTIATINRISDCLYNKNVPIHIVFNRLQNGNVDREKKYTKVSRELIKSSIKGLNIKFSYIRTNFLYYKNQVNGAFFMEFFYKRNKEFLEEQIDLLNNVDHITHLELLFKNKYLNKDYDFSEIRDFINISDNDIDNYRLQNKDYTNKSDEQIIEILQDNILEGSYHKGHINSAKVVIKDMFILMNRLRIIEFDENSTSNKNLIKEIKGIE